MKTSQVITAFAALFITATIIASTTVNRSNLRNGESGKYKVFSSSLVKTDGDLTKTDKKQVSIVQASFSENNLPVSEVDYSSLRFDVTKYINEDETESMELPVSEFDYLRFDVNQYMPEPNDVITELPAAEFNYLRFDVNEYMLDNPVDLSEMPADEFNYTRFDVTKYIPTETEIVELPEAE